MRGKPSTVCTMCLLRAHRFAGNTSESHDKGPLLGDPLIQLLELVQRNADYSLGRAYSAGGLDWRFGPQNCVWFSRRQKTTKNGYHQPSNWRHCRQNSKSGTLRAPKHKLWGTLRNPSQLPCPMPRISRDPQTESLASLFYHDQSHPLSGG